MPKKKPQIDIRLIQRCEPRFCHVKESCFTHRAEQHPAQPIYAADYSQAPTFKPANPIESCKMYKQFNDNRLNGMMTGSD